MTQSAILVVDDDLQLLDDVSSYLKGFGFTVHSAVNTASARSILARQNVDLILLDIIMQGEDGISFCRWLSENGGPPVIILSQKGEVENRVTGLRSGAEDYLPKPFDQEELLARVEVILRRNRHEGRHHRVSTYKFGDRSVDVDQETLTMPDSTVIALSRSETVILTMLLARPNEIVPREDLIQALRGRDSRPFERTIDNIIVRLRRKIEDNPSDPKWIKTVWGSGYRIVSSASINDELA